MFDGRVLFEHHPEDRIEIKSAGKVDAYWNPLDVNEPIRIVFADGCQYEIRRLPWKPAGLSVPPPSVPDE